MIQKHNIICLEMQSNVFLLLLSSFVLGLMLGCIIWKIDLVKLIPYPKFTGRRVPLIYIVTPSNERPTRYPDIIRLLYTLLHLENIHWLIIEDGYRTDAMLEELLSFHNIRYTYFAQFNNVPLEKQSVIKGVDQRNAALTWIRQNHKNDQKAVVYFADDDNTYSLELFDEIRFTKKLSILPVGLLNDKIIVRDGKVIGFGQQMTWYTRKFALDMAAFAINVDVLFQHPDLKFSSNLSRGYLETNFLEQFAELEDLEPKANNCTKTHMLTNELETSDAEFGLLKLARRCWFGILERAKFVDVEFKASYAILSFNEIKYSN